MMSSDEYRAKAVEASERAASLENPEWKSIFRDHADQWTRLADDADLQDLMRINLAIALAREEDDSPPDDLLIDEISESRS